MTANILFRIKGTFAILAEFSQPSVECGDVNSILISELLYRLSGFIIELNQSQLFFSTCMFTHVIIPFLIENYAPYLFKRESKSYIISNQKSSTFSLAATRVLTNSSVDIAVLLDSSVRRPSSVRIRVSSTALIDTAMLTQEAMHFFESGEYLL